MGEGLQLAGKWYQRTKISDEITLLQEPHVHPILRCNIWHIRGRDRDLLIDTGLGISSLKEEIQDLIDKPLLALATHIHFDHVGCLHEFDHRLLHQSEAGRMTDYQEFAFLQMPPGLEDYVTQGDASGFDEFLINAKPSKDFSIKGLQNSVC